MDENTVTRVHALASKSSSAFQHAASAPLLQPSWFPHPALGNAGVFPHAPQIASVAIGALQAAVEQLTHRVAKLESLFFVFEANQQRVAQVSAPLPMKDIRSMLHDTLTPVKEQIRQHENILMDLVQAVNHAAAWGYSNAAHPPDAAVSATPQKAHPHHADVVVSPLTRAEASQATDDPPYSDVIGTKTRIDRMRQLAQRMLADTTSPSTNKKQRRGYRVDPLGSPQSEGLSARPDDDGTEPHHSSSTGTATTCSSASSRDANRGKTFSSDSTLHPQGRNETTECSSTGDQHDTSNMLLQNVKQVLRKATTRIDGSSSTTVEDAVTVTPARVRFAYDNSSVGSVGSPMRPPAVYRQGLSTLLSATDVETTTSNSNSALGILRPQHYRRGVSDLVAHESAMYDSSAYSDAYQELVEQMHL